MEKVKTIELESLSLSLESYFGSLTPRKRDFSITNLRVKGYRDLLFKLESLLNVCIMTLDNPNADTHKAIVEPDVSILSVLEMAAQLIPHEEAEFLDEVWEHAWAEKEQ